MSVKFSPSAVKTMKPKTILAILLTVALSSFAVGQAKPKIMVGPAPVEAPQAQEAQVEDSAKNGAVTFEFVKGFKHTAVAIELSPDGSLFATAGLDKDVKLYRTSDWELIAESNAPQGMVLDLIFSEDGKQLVSCGDPKQVLVFDTETLNVLYDYKVRFRPERIAESRNDRVAIAGRSGYRAEAAMTEKWLSKGNKVHNKFIGGLASASDPRIVYSAGDQQTGTYSLARRIKKTQIISEIPGRPARVAMGKSDREVLVTTENKAVVIDVARKKTVETWELPTAKKVEDIFYWKAHDVYVTCDKEGFVRIWMRGHAQPIAEHKVSKFDVYQVLALNDSRIAVCGREDKPRSIAIWNLSFDKSKMPRPKMPAKVAVAETPADKPTTEATETSTKPMGSRSSAPEFVSLNSEFEIKKISPADLNLRKDGPSTMAEVEWEISKLEAASKKIPDSLKNFEPVQINDAIISPGKGTLYLATSEGLVSYMDQKSKLVKGRNDIPLLAACLSRDAVDGILIGEQGGHRIYEIRESGKLVYRGKAAPEDAQKEDQSVKRIVMSGSKYLALATSKVQRRVPEGDWIDEGLKSDNPILDFAILATDEIATFDEHTSIIRVHPESGKAREILLNQSTEKKEDPLAKASSLLTKKMLPGPDGELFCVFAKKRTQSDIQSKSRSVSNPQPVTCGCGRLYGSTFNDTFTYHDIDWSIAKEHKSLKLIVDFHPGPSGESDDVLFLTPTGLGRVKSGKTEFWDSEFGVENNGIELSRIQDIGESNYLVFTTDGVRGHDVYHIRKKK